MGHGKPRLYSCCDKVIKLSRFDMDGIPNCGCGEKPKSMESIGSEYHYPIVFRVWFELKELENKNYE